MSLGIHTPEDHPNPGLGTLSCLSSLGQMTLGAIKSGMAWAWVVGILVEEVGVVMSDRWGLVGRQRLVKIGDFGSNIWRMATVRGI
jgi:hypothetical protein